MEEKRSPCSSNSRTTHDEEVGSQARDDSPNRSRLSQNLDSLHGSISPSIIVEDFRNFKRSATPARILFLRDDAWTDFPQPVFDALKAGFVTGKTTVEVHVQGESRLVDFLHMLHIDMVARSANSIGWIDVDGQCFFPRAAVGSGCVHERGSTNIRQKLEIEIRVKDQPNDRCSVIAPTSETQTPNKIYLSGGPVEEQSDESPSSPTARHPRWPNAILLSNGDRSYELVERVFYAGTRRLAPDTAITSVHKCSYMSRTQSSRLQAFQTQLQMTKASRGSANVKYAWFGTSAQGVADAMEHGFSQPNSGPLGANAYGVGIHLSPPHHPHNSSLLADTDENGEKHILLCRVIMGNVERVPAGSRQLHPSSSEFDSGVDDVENPKWFIVWGTHMNTHIFPEYIVSFNSSKQPQGPRRMTQAKMPPLTAISFPKLFAEIERSLHPSRIQALENLYKQHKAGKFNKETFIRYLRSIAGDKLLSSTIKRIRGHL